MPRRASPLEDVSRIAGTAISSTSSVMAIANTPSLNASRRFFLCLIFADLSSAISPPLIRAGRLARGAGTDPLSN